MNRSDAKEIVCNFDVLYRAMKQCKRGVMWKKSVAGYVKNSLSNIYKLKSDIENDTYKLGNYICFKIFEPKERTIVSTRIKDRVFQRAFCGLYLYDKITNSFIYDNVACQKGKGTELGRKRLISHIQKYYRKHGIDGWVLKIDLKNYFGSTPHILALNSVKNRLDDEWAIKTVENVIKSFDQGPDPEVGMGL